MSDKQEDPFHQSASSRTTPSFSISSSSMDKWKMQGVVAEDIPPPPVQTREGVTLSEIEYLSQRSKDTVEDLGSTATQEPPPTSTKRLQNAAERPIHSIPEMESTSPTVISVEDLWKRDNMAINYGRSRLLHGDTFVVVRYPTTNPVCDATGFLLDTQFRVHSHKLLATGSKVFAKMLSEESQQKYLQRPFFKNIKIPKGVQYVLDLTPATDDDDALELVTSLSCPKGILHWSAACSRLGIPQKFVCGVDEKAMGQLELSAISAPPIIKGKFFRTAPLDYFGQQLKEATERSIKDNGGDTPVEPIIAQSTSTHQIPADYCGIRHCAGIERMLQLIEGKEARLDSAPKVWTVAMLAGFFDCTSAVVDALCTWVISQNNGIIIEILPESCLRLGLVLRSELITRAAFAVLVSEEALCIGGQTDNIPFKREKATPFGRLREDLDDDTLNMVQHAGRSFFERIDESVKDLLDRNMPWLEALPEHAKLQKFKRTLQGEGSNEEALQMITNLQKDLVHYIRGRLFRCLLCQLRPDQISGMQTRRESESYILGVPTNVCEVYDHFTSQQRVLTRQFWELVRSVGWTATHSSSNLLYSDLELHNPHFRARTNISVASHFRIKQIFMNEIFKATDAVNLEIFDHVTKLDPIPTITKPNFTLANISEPIVWQAPTLAEKKARVLAFAKKYEEDMMLGRGHIRSQTYQMALAFTQMNNCHSAPYNSEYFDIHKLMDQVREYINKKCDKMMDRGENRSFTLPETLVCLTDAEYKFLPLFAGGFEDGTGGVYQDELPPALAGPSGPGPSYHTGFSIASVGSEGSEGSEGTVDWESVGRGANTDSTLDGWSRDVDDGFTDHIDRRRIGSEVSFGSQAFSELGVESEDSFSEMDIEEEPKCIGKGKERETETEPYVGKGKGKEVERETTGIATTSVKKEPSAIDSLMSDDFFVGDGDGEEDFNDEDDEFDFMDDSGDDTATEKGENDHHDSDEDI